MHDASTACTRITAKGVQQVHVILYPHVNNQSDEQCHAHAPLHVDIAESANMLTRVRTPWLNLKGDVQSVRCLPVNVLLRRLGILGSIRFLLRRTCRDVDNCTFAEGF